MYFKKMPIAVSLICLSGCFSVKETPSKPVSKPVANPAYDIKSKPFFPLIAWNTREINRSDIEGQADCGITITIATHPNEIKLCESYGLKAIVRGMDHAVWAMKKGDSAEVIKKQEKKIREKVKLYKKNPVVYGFSLWDEPVKKTFAVYERSLSIIKEECPGKIVYTNIFPNYSTPYQHGFKNYREFVEKYCDLILKYPMPLLVYDSYANKKTDYGKTEKERLCKFLSNLETVRAISLEKGIPFWNTILSCSHDYYPAPKKEDIYWEVFTSLAYGSGGITYFTWQSHPALAFQGGPVDILHHKTRIWDYIKECNFQVRTLAPIIQKLRSTGVYYSTIPEDKELFAKFKKLPGRLIKDVKCELKRSNFLIGEFTHEDGSEWCIIVNLDIENIAHFKIKTIGDRKIQSYNNYLGTPCSLDTWLKPGQGKLYRIEKL